MESVFIMKARWAILAALLAALAPAAGAAQTPGEKPKPAQSIAELKQQIEKILADNDTPGASIAIVRRDGPEWVAGVGKSDLATNHAATDETLFRIGSVSKGFAALSILKLVNEGKLSLMDPVRRLVPEIWFENRWEATDPVRVADLLEHTTGWDDWHIAEFAKDAKGMTLREGLDYYRKSRVSRWRPGTRMSYSSSGPAVAAYIVEKLTGKRFEDYVAGNFFSPIGMKTATYFEVPSPRLATLYNDGKTPTPYWNLLERPAGAINASARDMAAYLQFYLNRGKVGDVEVMPAASIERMETPTRTWEAQQGLKAGYGLCNYWSVYDGFVWHGHDGTVAGGDSSVAYMPDYGVGYFYSTNSSNYTAFTQIGEAIRAYITRGLTRPAVPAAAALPANAQEYAGWYVFDAPRDEILHFLERAIGLDYVRFRNGQMLLTSIAGGNHTLAPVSGADFRELHKDAPPDPVATAALIAPNAEGRFIFFGETSRKIPTLAAWLQIALVFWFALACAAILLYAPFWLIGGLFKKRRRPQERAMRLWPLTAVLCFIAFVTLFVVAVNISNTLLGSPTVWSVGVCLSSLLFGVAAVASAIALRLTRKEATRSFTRWFAWLTTPALLVAALYLAWWGVIGIRTWV